MAPFSAGLTDFQSFEVASEKQAALDYVENIEANGLQTHVYRAVGDAFHRYRAISENSDRIAVLLVYTDGKDNSPGSVNMGDVVQQFGLERREHDWLYYSTLGVDLDAADRRALEGSGISTYNNNPAGTVAPIKIVQPRYGLLDFGNLKQGGLETRTLRFNTSAGLPRDVQIQVEARFDSLQRQAVYAVLEPSSFNPRAEEGVKLTLALENGTPAEGQYAGTLRLSSTDPSVLIVPSTVALRFRNEEAAIVKVGLAGGGTPPLALGTADPYRSEGRGPEIAFNLTPNARAQSQGGTFIVRFEPDTDNPAALPEGAILVNGQPLVQGRREVSLAEGNELRLQAHLSEPIPEGGYSGTFYLENGTVEVDASDLGGREMPLAFDVPSEPWSLVDWLLLLLALLAALTLLALVVGWILTSKIPWWKPDYLPAGAAVTIEKPSNEWREIPIGDRRAWRMGPGGDDLESAPGNVVIKPKRNGRTLVVKVTDETGGAQLLREGERIPMAFAEEDLDTGDRIIVGPYTLYYQS